MPTNVDTPVRKHDSPIFLSLPREIRDEIYSYLLVDSLPIDFDPNNGFKPASKEVQQFLKLIDLTVEARKIFYQHNTFHVLDDELQAFLSYRPSTTTGEIKEDDSPKAHVRNLDILIDATIFYRDDPAPALRSLLECPNLRKVDIYISGFEEVLSELNSTFSQIAGVCVELSDKLGGEALKVDVCSMFERGTWTLADFKSGKPPGTLILRTIH